MTSTATSLGSELAKNMINAIDEGTKQAYQMYWHIFINFLSQHHVAVLVGLILILVLSVAVYILTGRWAMLGSVLYWYLYFLVLFLIGLKWSSDIFVTDIFHLFFTAILNPLCYLIVRVILNKTGIRKRY